MNSELLLAIFGGAAVFNSLAFGGYLLVRRESLIKNTLLGLILIATGLRIGKSIIILLFPDISDVIPAIGLIGMASIGPLTLFYIMSLTETRFGWRLVYWVHFLFAFTIGWILFFATPKIVFWLYFSAAIHLGAYLLASFKLLYKMEYLELQFNWLRTLLISNSVIWLVFAAQLFGNSVINYLVGTVLSAIILYALIFSAIQHIRVFARRKSVDIQEERLTLIKARIMKLFEEDKVYLETGLTLVKVAYLIKEKPYLVSVTINKGFKQSFSEFINGYRIRDCEKLLLSEGFANRNIESIAFDCGFNTPSAFYNCFRKVHGLTPKEFQQKHLVTGNHRLSHG